MSLSHMLSLNPSPEKKHPRPMISTSGSGWSRDRESANHRPRTVVNKQFDLRVWGKTLPGQRKRRNITEETRGRGESVLFSVFERHHMRVSPRDWSVMSPDQRGVHVSSERSTVHNLHWFYLNIYSVIFLRGACGACVDDKMFVWLCFQKPKVNLVHTFPKSQAFYFLFSQTRSP